jgi:hypothetical protein
VSSNTRRDLAEVSINMIAGAVLNCVITYFLFEVTVGFALWSTLIFFVASWVRSYGFRLLFRHIENKQLKRQ